MPTNEVVTTGYAPRLAFEPFHKRTQRWSALVCHRRAGKTVACIADLVDAALRCKLPDPRFAYLAPFFTQAKDVAWVYLKRMVRDIPGAETNESELRVDLPNGGRVRLYGADNYDRLRGLFLDGVVLDEFADMDPRAWPEVIRPALSDRKGWATFIGTPKGRNAFFEVYSRAEVDDDWFSLMLKADTSGLIDAEELEDARRSMTPEQFAQEYLCSFEAAIIGAYYGKEMAEAERTGRIRQIAYDHNVPVQTAWDLGHSDSTAIWFFQMVGPQVHVIDFYENHGQQLPHYAAVLASKGYHYGDHWFPQDVKATVLGMDRSRVETLTNLKIKPRIVMEHKVMDGINAGRVMFDRVWFDADRCKDGLEALRQYKADFDEKKKAFKDAPRHDWASHPADAFRYLAMAWREVVVPAADKPKPEPKGIMDMTWNQAIKAAGPRRSSRV